ncbi:nicotinate phosphoribosyltransferase [Sanguibacter sp. A247]|uniref:nicotinate phosphoribosyltransferase n=1 Tax=unclassified Sanguibacter TaxID=2645534 RepID=UPI003FD79EC7
MSGQTRRSTTPSLKTDHYELTMLQAALASGAAHKRAVFELFTRRLPTGRRYGVVAGIGRALEAVAAFRFDDAQLDYLRENAVVNDATLEYLERYRFTGTIHAYREGELFFPQSPIVTVEGTFGEAVLLETVLLSILNHDSAVASAAARMVQAAQGAGIIEMGSRRTGDEAAVVAARAAYVAGFGATSNLEAGFRYGIPTTGTAAHAFTLAHDSEPEAFAAQVASLGAGTTLLVDTYDIPQGIRNAVAAAGPELGGIRIDSGDLYVETTRARVLLDELGATRTKIVVSSDLDEYVIDDLVSQGAPIDGYGIGTRVVTGSGAPTASMVYKLVEIEGADGAMHSVAKKSADKASVGGLKRATRVLDAHGVAVAELAVPRTDPADADHPAGTRSRELQVTYVRDGICADLPSLDEVRAHHRAALAELPPSALDVVAGTPYLTARS